MNDEMTDTTGNHPIDQFAWRIMSWRNAFEQKDAECRHVRALLADAERKIRALEGK